MKQFSNLNVNKFAPFYCIENLQARTCPVFNVIISPPHIQRSKK